MSRGKSDVICAPSYLPSSFSRKIILTPSLRSHLSSPQFPGVEQSVQGRAVGGREESPAAGSRRAEGILRSRRSASRPGVPGLSRPRVRGSRGGCVPLAQRSRLGAAERSRWVWSQARGSRSSGRAGAEGSTSPKCGRRPPAPQPRPGHQSVVRSRAHSFGAARPSPGVPRGALPASAAPPSRPAAHLESRERRGEGGGGGRGREGGGRSSPRVRGAREEAEREAGVAAAVCARRAGELLGGGAAPQSAPPSLPRAASTLLRHRHTPTKHPLPSALRPPPSRQPPPLRLGQPQRAATPGLARLAFQLLPRGELSPARFFLFCSSPLSSGWRWRRQGDGDPAWGSG